MASDKALTEDGFVKEARWYRNWGYHWDYYRDIFLFARANAIRHVRRQRAARGGADRAR